MPVGHEMWHLVRSISNGVMLGITGLPQSEFGGAIERKAQPAGQLCSCEAQRREDEGCRMEACFPTYFLPGSSCNCCRSLGLGFSICELGVMSPFPQAGVAPDKSQGSRDGGGQSSRTGVRRKAARCLPGTFVSCTQELGGFC